MLNTLKILKRMDSLGVDAGELARFCGISPDILADLVYNRRETDTVVAERLRRGLRLAGREAGDYFFCSGVAFCATPDKEKNFKECAVQKTASNYHK